MEPLNELLRTHHLRCTPQRKEILQVLTSCRGHHLDAVNIHALLAKKGGQAASGGLATVYRTLDLFEKLGLVTRLSMDNAPARYELSDADSPVHHHLICLSCGSVQEISLNEKAFFAEQALVERKFVVADTPIKLFGWCSRCASSANMDKKGMSLRKPVENTRASGELPIWKESSTYEGKDIHMQE